MLAELGRALPAALLLALPLTALGGLLLHRMRRRSVTAAMTTLALVPLVALGLYGGALVDQYDRRRVALFSATFLFVVTTALAAQAWLHVDSVLLLYALVAVQSAGFAINNPARTSIIPRLVEARLLPADLKSSLQP